VSTKKKQIIVFGILLLSLLFLFITPLAHAADGPDGLVPHGCQEGCPCSLCDLYELARRVVNFLLFSLSIPIAAVAFFWGGFLLLTSGGSPQKITQGKSAMTNAVIGIALAFFAWSIFNAILTSVTFQIGLGEQNFTDWFNPPSCQETVEGENKCLEELPPPGSLQGPGGITPGGNPTPPEFGFDAEIRSELSNEGVGVNKPCIDPSQNLEQTCLDNLPASAVEKIIEVNQDCKSRLGSSCVTITGGTEPGHGSHGPGIPTVDMRYNRDTIDALENSGLMIDSGFGPGVTCENAGGSAVPCAGPGDIHHIHVNF